MGFWSLAFMLWTSGRRGVMHNLQAIHPRSWTITDNVRFKELRVIPDWEFEGIEHVDALHQGGGAIVLTAHMGSYDLGAHVFTEISGRQILMVRAPEIDPATRDYEHDLHTRTAASLRIDFNTKAEDLALELMSALSQEQIVAIQGDRVTPGIASMTTTLFGRPALLPSGPFALAMAARAAVHPIFIIRLGRRRYRLIAGEPFTVPRTTRDRDADLQRALDRWSSILEQVARAHWYQWYAFQPVVGGPRS